MQTRRRNKNPRRGAALVWAAGTLVLVFAFAAFTVDIGYIAITKTELQNTADASALGSVVRLADGVTAVKTEAKRIASANEAAEESVTLALNDIEPGIYDLTARIFTATNTDPNAVRVTARRNDRPLFFGPVLGQNKFTTQATAIAILNPRDIVFVIDLSGSMNDDTEPCWATDAINSMYAPSGYGTVATELMQDVYDDFGYGMFPGTVTYLGNSLGVPSDKYAYAEMTKDDGPLTSLAIAAAYRIANTDSEDVRRQKSYSWIIDNQIATTMPLARPTPDSTVNFDYWADYLDYTLDSARVGTAPPPSGGGGGGGGGGGTGGPTGPTPPPTIGFIENTDQFDLMARGVHISPVQVASLGLFNTAPPQTAPTPGTPRLGSSTSWDWLPPKQSSHRIYHFNNPAPPFPGGVIPYDWQNKIGYVTYVQFMMDFGYERSPDLPDSINADPTLGTKCPLSVLSPHCPRHTEVTAGGSFSFPPRSQPMHALRRALIAGIDLVKQRNSGLTQGDRVSIVTFDGRDAHHEPRVVLPLTSDYQAAMMACTDLQASADIGPTTSTESGLSLARQHLTKKTSATNPGNNPIGPQGRGFAKKVIILLTDGLPNAWDSSSLAIDNYIASAPSVEYYGQGYDWYNSVLMQTSRFLHDDKGDLFPVGMGLGADYPLMDRIARLAATDDGGLSPRGSGNPAQYEARLINTLSIIVKRPGGRLIE